MAGARKAYPLRVDPVLWAAIERLAASDLRSANAETECLLREALKARGIALAEPPSDRRRRSRGEAGTG